MCVCYGCVRVLRVYLCIGVSVCVCVCVSVGVSAGGQADLPLVERRK